MSNFLDMRCPKCGGTDRIDIHAKVWLRVTDNGTDTDAAGCGDHEYEPESPAMCSDCGHTGTVHGFEWGEPKEELAANPELLHAVEGMLAVFDHAGLRGLVWNAARDGWRIEHVDAMTAACAATRAAVAKAKA